MSLLLLFLIKLQGFLFLLFLLGLDLIELGVQEVWGWCLVTTLSTSTYTWWLVLLLGALRWVRSRTKTIHSTLASSLLWPLIPYFIPWTFQCNRYVSVYKTTPPSIIMWILPCTNLWHTLDYWALPPKLALTGDCVYVVACLLFYRLFVVWLVGRLQLSLSDLAALNVGRHHQLRSLPPLFFFCEILKHGEQRVLII